MFATGIKTDSAKIQFLSKKAASDLFIFTEDLVGKNMCSIYPLAFYSCVYIILYPIIYILP